MDGYLDGLHFLAIIIKAAINVTGKILPWQLMEVL